MSQPEGRATWADIPTELVEQILGDCDYSSLLNLGRVNKDLNKIALRAYLGSKVVDRLVIDRRVDVSGALYDPPWQPARALCLALWIPNITAFSYQLEFNNYECMVHEFRCIVAFLRNMSAPTLKELALSARFLPVSDHNALRVDGERHLKIWSELIEVALLKGCKELDIQEMSIGVQPTHLNPSRLSPPTPAEPSVQPRSFLQSSGDVIRRAMNFKRSPSNTQAQGLESVRLASASLLRRPLLPYTLRLLRRNAETIKRLTLFPHTDPREDTNWDGFLSGVGCIKFRNLTHFTFRGSERIRARHLYDLFVFQKTIVEIDLDISVVFCCSDNHLWPLSLPRLRTLRIGPMASSTMGWVFGNFRTPNLDRIIFPRLSPCTTTSMMLNLGKLRKMKKASRVTLEISVPLHDEKWIIELEWLLEYFEQRWGSSDVRKYRKVELIGRISQDIHRRRLMDILPRWMALFPFLEELTFSLCDGEPLEEDLVQAIAERCPRLKKVQTRSLLYQDKSWEVRDGTCNVA